MSTVKSLIKDTIHLIASSKFNLALKENLEKFGGINFNWIKNSEFQGPF